MHLFKVEAGQSETALRALKTIALADGQWGTHERTLIECAAELYGSDADIDALDPIEPEQVARVITSPEDRLRLVQGGLIMGMADMSAHPKEADYISHLQSALDVSEQRVEIFRRMAVGQRLRVRAAIVRAFHTTQKEMFSVISKTEKALSLIHI